MTACSEARPPSIISIPKGDVRSLFRSRFANGFGMTHLTKISSKLVDMAQVQSEVLSELL
jgi:hypothetical protein